MSESTRRPANSAQDDAWREFLLSSLKDCDVQRAPKRRLLNVAVSLFAIIAIVIAARVSVAVLEELLENAEPPVVVVIGAIWVLFAILVLARLRNFFLRRAWQARAKTAEEQLARPDSRRPVFYLRSFGLDTQIGRPTFIERLLGTIPLANAEQTLTRRFQRVGPVIAIGRPSEKLPALGAARFYVADDLWQQKVADIVSVSQIVVWASGVTKGLRWEIGHLLESVEPERLVLWCHPHLMNVGSRRREQEWQQFLQNLGPLFPKPLPQKLGKIRFIHFNDDWSPIPVSPAWKPFQWPIRPLLSGQDRALKQLISAKQLVPPPSPTTLKRRKQIKVALAATAAVALLIAIGSWIVYARMEQVKRDQDALESMALGMMLIEERGLSLEQIWDNLKEHKTPQDRYSRKRFDEIDELTGQYMAVFDEAHKEPRLEYLLYGSEPSLVVGVGDVKEARLLLARVSRVQARLEEFWTAFKREQESLPSDIYQRRTNQFEQRLAARRQLLNAQEAGLRILSEHPKGWSLQVGYLPATRNEPIFGEGQAEGQRVQLPVFDDPDLQARFEETLEVGQQARRSLRISFEQR